MIRQQLIQLYKSFSHEECSYKDKDNINKYRLGAQEVLFNPSWTKGWTIFSSAEISLVYKNPFLSCRKCCVYDLQIFWCHPLAENIDQNSKS